MKYSERILLVEDDEDMRESCRQAQEAAGHVVVEAGSAREAEPILLREEFDLVITDLRMPHGGGEEVLRLVKSISPETPVLVITAYPSVESAVEAFRGGVTDYLLKPFTGDQLVEAIERAMASKHAGDRATLLRRIGSGAADMPEMMGASESFRSMLVTIRRIAPLDGAVLVYGETGSGKELVTSAIHRLSQRSAGPFVIVNCAAIPENLLEAELFGFERGAFTGATGSKAGLFEAADSGSLFLDEVAELSASAQAKLLRCIEGKAVRRIGALHDRPVDARILAATHKDLREEVAGGRFREDLFYRLAVLEVRVPPLRERPEDILSLAADFLDRFRKKAGRDVIGFSDAALDRLAQHGWPGNVRELQNVIQKALASCATSVIEVDDLQLRSSPAAPMSAAAPDRRRWAIDEYERKHVTEALAQHAGNVTHTARALGVHRTTLQRLIKRLGIETKPVD